MILGVDHLALTALDLDSARAQLESAGFVRAFAEESAPNAATKRRLLAEYRELHALAYFRPAGGGLPLEVVVHARAYAHPPGPFMPVLAASEDIGRRRDGANGNGPDWAGILAANDLGAAELRVWDGLEAEFWFLQSPVPVPLRAVCTLLRVPDLDAELAFWTALGFKTVAGAPGPWRRMRLDSPVSGWQVDLLVAGAPGADPAFLDSCGFPCLALLTTDLDADTRRLEAAGGHDFTAPFEVSVNEKLLRVAVCRSPGGALCELLQVRRPAGSQRNPQQRTV